MKMIITRKNLFTFAACILIVALFSAGCGRDTASDIQGGNTGMTPRQKEILAAEGLPTDPSQLTERQLSAIIGIEEMLEYLEEKYGGVFEYYEYIPAGGSDMEQMTAVCENGFVTVSRSPKDGKFVYEDDYAEVAVEGRYSEKLNEFFSEKLDDSKFVIVSDVVSTELETGEGDVLGNSSASSWMFIDQTAVNAGELNALAASYAEWIKPLTEGQATMLKICVLASGKLNEVNELNYEEMTVGEQVIEKITCTISDSGEVTII